MVRLLISLNGFTVGALPVYWLQLTANAWQTILISHHYHEIHFLIFILMMAPSSHHLIQISIVEEYRIFGTINLDKNDDFVHTYKQCHFNAQVSRSGWSDVTSLRKECHYSYNVASIYVFSSVFLHPTFFFIDMYKVT